MVNHTSDKHEWFARARRAPAGSKERDFYVWSDTPTKYPEARIIFKDTETSNWTWDPVAGAYYWHRFYGHQPDLNYDNPEVEKAIFRVVDFWLEMGVDGLRLDAVPYLYEREGTNCENLPETHAFLKRLRAHIESKFRGRMLLAEANQWPSDAAKYFGEGDECNMAFHFPLMPRMFMAIQMEDRYPIVEILEETPPVAEGCQWAIFLRNHDELTLEMVTDEERDYMYRTYAHDKEARLNLGIRRRLAPLLGNDRRKIELMNALLFTLPGTPVIYYGDEIGMGDNIYLGDRNGVRTPMQWSADLNSGFSRTNPQKLYLPVIIDPKYHYEAVNVENQQGDTSSLLWWFKRMIFLRKRLKALSRGTIQFLAPDSEKVLAFVRRHDSETMLVVANLSRKPQCVDLNLSSFQGYSVQEVVGGTPFPEVGAAPYRLTMGAYSYYIFSLVEKAQPLPQGPSSTVEFVVSRSLREVFFDKRYRGVLEASVLPSLLVSSRWYGGKARTIERVALRDTVEVRDLPSRVRYEALVDVTYSEGFPETYYLPIAYMSDAAFAGLPDQARPRVIARIRSAVETGVAYDATTNPALGEGFLQSFLNRRTFGGARGKVAYLSTPELRKIDLRGAPDGREVRVVSAEQSNSSLVIGEKVIIKVLRRVEEGIQPEVELSQFLTRRGFGAVPPFLGHAEYQPEEGEPITLAMAEGFVKNQGDSWKLFATEFETFAEKVSQGQNEELLEALPGGTLLEAARGAPFDGLFGLTGALFAENVSLLGKRTGEFHIALSSDTYDPDFAPEPFGRLGQISLSQEMTGAARRALLFASRAKLPDGAQAAALSELLKRKDSILRTFDRLRSLNIDSVKCRIHGDYHLGQVLYTGKDFVVIDYEGEPARALSERRLKRSPLRDVAGMIRSLHYVATSTLLRKRETERYAQYPRIGDWGRLWYVGVASTFLRAYLETIKGTPLVPREEGTLGAMLDAYLMGKALYELTYELNNRPGWVGIPIQGIAEILGEKTMLPETTK